MKSLHLASFHAILPRFMSDAFKELEQFIGANSQFILVTHRRPDGDALGSLLAMGAYLESIGKRAQLYCFDAIPSYFNYLPGIEKIKNSQDDFWLVTGAAIILDCGDLNMTGLPGEAFANKRLAVVDHHISNPRYGAINAVLPNVAATTEIIYQYLRSLNFAINKNLATCLFTGIYTDTDAFSNLATTSDCLAVAAALLKLGANFKDITANTMQNKSIPALKLWGRALQRLRLDSAKGIAVTVIRANDLAECQARPEDTEGVASLLNHLSDVKMSMVLREQDDGTVKGSLRTTHELIDVAKIAKLLGGGGHAKAAGFTVKGHIAETEKGWKIVE